MWDGKCPTDQARGHPELRRFEVRFPDGRPSKYFYWNDMPSQRLGPNLASSDVALEQAKLLLDPSAIG
jgi:hypothetical protein